MSGAECKTEIDKAEAPGCGSAAEVVAADVALDVPHNPLNTTMLRMLRKSCRKTTPERTERYSSTK